MADTRKYLDYEGLDQFWDLSKKYFNDPINEVGFKGSRDSEFSKLPVEIIRNADGSRKVGVQLDLSAYALKEDITATIHFRGVVAKVEDLPSVDKSLIGDMWIVEENNSEYVCVEKDGVRKWEKLGPIIDLSGYYTKLEVDAKCDELAQGIDEEFERAQTQETLLSQAISEDRASIAKEIEDRKAADATNLYEAKHYTDIFIDDLDERLENEITRANDAEQKLDEKIAKTAADLAKEIVDRSKAIEYAFDSAIHSIKEHEVKQLFGLKTNATAATLEDVMAAAISGDTIILNENVSFAKRIAMDDGRDLTIDATGKTIANTDRAFDLRGGSTLEIKGGTVDCSAYPAVFVGDDATIIVDGVVVNATNQYGGAIATNGTNTDSKIAIRNNSTVNGTIYAPAGGTTIIDGSTIISGSNNADGCAMYVKSGNLVIKNSKIVASGAKGDWKYDMSGFNGVSSALIVENSNYGGHGNVSVTIDDKTQFVAGEGGDNFDNFGILIINVGGQKCDNVNIAQKYYVAEVPVDTNVHYFSLDGRGDSIKVTEVL